MNRQIRRLGLVFGVLLFALLINLSFQQVFLADSIKAFEFDELEYFLDSVDLDKLPKPCIKAIITTLRPYSTEFEFWYEFIEKSNKRL